MDTDTQTKTALEDHWRASDRGDTEAEAEHAIYRADATLDYPQSGERFRGCAAISEQRSEHPASRHFTVLRIVGNGDLWVSECVITYDGVPTYSVSIMEFVHPCVVHETQYFADAFGAPEWRTALAELPGIGVHVTDVTGIAATPSGQGCYYVVGADGAVYAFGDAKSFGSLPALGVSVTNIVSIVPTPDGGGYWLIGSDGGVFAFGDAVSQGSLPGVGVHVNDVVGAVPT